MWLARPSASASAAASRPLDANSCRGARAPCYAAPRRMQRRAANQGTAARADSPACSCQSRSARACDRPTPTRPAT